ncbi:hypothetical protein [Streptomyces sp. NPDC001070]
MSGTAHRGGGEPAGRPVSRLRTQRLSQSAREEVPPARAEMTPKGTRSGLGGDLCGGAALTANGRTGPGRRGPGHDGPRALRRAVPLTPEAAVGSPAAGTAELKERAHR